MYSCCADIGGSSNLTYEEMIDLDGGSFWGAVGGILDCIAGLATGAGGVLLCLVPEPTMTTKYGGIRAIAYGGTTFVKGVSEFIENIQ